MLKVEGATVIFAREARAKFLTTPTFRSNHARFCINETVRTDRQDFLAVERAVSQPEDSLSLFIHENCMFLLNCLLRGCIFGLSGSLVSFRWLGGPWPPGPPGSYAYV